MPCLKHVSHECPLVMVDSIRRDTPEITSSDMIIAQCKNGMTENIVSKEAIWGTNFREQIVFLCTTGLPCFSVSM